MRAFAVPPVARAATPPLIPAPNSDPKLRGATPGTGVRVGRPALNPPAVPVTTRGSLRFEHFPADGSSR
ncbi:hypothetical protein [Dactylosporangium sp. NPDC005555]|uniref:hypothetical protein n=1 Tax=Dactylosporangium sp. NPDC005555 TaxID=3154889 RepID=UPI0033AE77A1